MAGALVDQSLAEATDETVCAAALMWLNDTRAEYGLEALSELPRGVRRSSETCALALGLNGISDYSVPFYHSGRRGGSLGATFARDGQVIHRPAPSIVGEFLRRFDDGRYPHLVRD